MSLLCPKCTNAMRQYERNDVIIDQCTECGGIFLDRGELERLAQAEANYYNPQAAQPLPARDLDDRPRDDRREDRRDDRRDDGPRRYVDRDYDRPVRYSDDRDYRRDRDDRDYRRDRDDDRRYGRGRRRKKEGFFGELMDLLD